VTTDDEVVVVPRAVGFVLGTTPQLDQRLELGVAHGKRPNRIDSGGVEFVLEFAGLFAQLVKLEKIVSAIQTGHLVLCF